MYCDVHPPFSVVNAFAERWKAEVPDLRSHLPLDLCRELVEPDSSKRNFKEATLFSWLLLKATLIKSYSPVHWNSIFQKAPLHRRTMSDGSVNYIDKKDSVKVTSGNRHGNTSFLQILLEIFVSSDSWHRSKARWSGIGRAFQHSGEISTNENARNYSYWTMWILVNFVLQSTFFKTLSN